MIAVYAMISSHLGIPLRFPGKPGAYRSLIEMTDAGLLAQASAQRSCDAGHGNAARPGFLFQGEKSCPRRNP